MINIYLNVKCRLTFLVVFTPRLSLIQENKHICNIHTLGDTNEKNVGSRYPTFPYVEYDYNQHARSSIQVIDHDSSCSS